VKRNIGTLKKHGKRGRGPEKRSKRGRSPERGGEGIWEQKKERLNHIRVRGHGVPHGPCTKAREGGGGGYSDKRENGVICLKRHAPNPFKGEGGSLAGVKGRVSGWKKPTPSLKGHSWWTARPSCEGRTRCSRKGTRGLRSFACKWGGILGNCETFSVLTG